MCQIADAELHASPCQIIISSEVVAVLHDQIKTTQLSSNSFHLFSLHGQQVVQLSNMSHYSNSLSALFVNQAEAALISLVSAVRRCVPRQTSMNFYNDSFAEQLEGKEGIL